MTDFKFTTKDDISTLHENIISFVPRYIENRKEDYKALKQAVAAEDFEIIRDYCHKVIGTARSYHFFQLEEITKKLQEYYRAGEISLIRELMPVYDAYIQNIFMVYSKDPTPKK